MNINVMALINKLSYGIVSRNILKELDLTPHKVTLFPIGNTECDGDEIVHLTNMFSRQPEFDASAPCIRIFHQFGLAESIGRGKRVGFPIFELDTFNKTEINHLKSVDQLLVPSKWAAQIIKHNGINIPTDVIPLGADPSIFSPSPLAVSTKTKFFTIGKIESRKLHDKLHEIFRKSFTPKDDVELNISWTNHFIKPEEEQIWQNMYRETLGEQVNFIPWFDDQRDIARFINQNHCCIYPSLAEGWGLGGLEALACGRHLIMTNYSGQTEYLTESNARLIEIDKLVPAYDGVWFNGQGLWANFGEPQEEQLITHLREIHKLHKQGELKLNTEGIKTVKQFTWANSVQKLITSIS